MSWSKRSQIRCLSKSQSFTAWGWFGQVPWVVFRLLIYTGLLWFELIQQRGGCDFAVTFRATSCFNFGFGTIWDSPFFPVTHFQIPVVHFHAIQAIGWLHMLWMSQKQYFETDLLWCQRLYSCHPLPQCGPLKTQDSSLTDSSCNLMAAKILVVLFLNYVEWTLCEKFSLCP